MNMNPQQLLQEFQKFRQQTQGNPQQIIQQMMQQGKVTQQQLDQAQAMARQFSGMLPH